MYIFFFLRKSIHLKIFHLYGQKFTGRLFLSLNLLIKCALKLENLDTLANSHHKVQIMSFMYIVHII